MVVQAVLQGLEVDAALVEAWVAHEEAAWAVLVVQAEEVQVDLEAVVVQEEEAEVDMEIEMEEAVLEVDQEVHLTEETCADGRLGLLGVEGHLEVAREAP